MAAFDFPPTPTVGTLYPTVAVAGQPQYRWNGSEWTAATFDPAGYVRKSGDAMTGALSLAGDPTQALHAVPKQYIDAQRTRISLAGGKSFDVQVPVGAVSARISAFIMPTTAAPVHPLIQLSFSPGVFVATADYPVTGFAHWGGSGTVSPLTGAQSGYYFAGSHENGDIHYLINGHMILKRINSAASVFSGMFDSSAYVATMGFTRSLSYCHVNAAASGSALSILAFRLSSTFGDDWAAESYLIVEWF